MQKEIYHEEKESSLPNPGLFFPVTGTWQLSENYLYYFHE